MKAAVYDRYGAADVVAIRDIARPSVKPGDLLVEVRATTVTTADWRVRASAFPGGMWLFGRLVMGLFRPRHKVLGLEFAGRVAEVGAGVDGFSPGDAVFGFSAGFGAHAEFLAVPAAGPVAITPATLDFDEAAAIPFGALCALAFLRDFAGVRPGWKVLVGGASGGVGVYAVQIARHLGAEVTAVCSAANHDLVRGLGADHLIDYRSEDYADGGERFDLVFDTAGTTTFAHARRALKPGGIFLPLEFGLKEAAQALVARLAGGKRIMLRISGDSRDALETVKALVEAGEVRPVVDSRYPLAQIVAAHRRVEGRHKTGSVVVTVAGR